MVSYACKFLKLRHHLHSSFEEKRHREKKNNAIQKRQNRKFLIIAFHVERKDVNILPVGSMCFLTHIIVVWFLKLTEPYVVSHPL
jgi:hypothetical protein